MVKSHRMRVANEKASKNITLRGNVPKTTVSLIYEVLFVNFGMTIRLNKIR